MENDAIRQDLGRLEGKVEGQQVWLQNISLAIGDLRREIQKPLTELAEKSAQHDSDISWLKTRDFIFGGFGAVVAGIVGIWMWFKDAIGR